VTRAIIRTVRRIRRRLSMQSVELTNYIYKMPGRDTEPGEVARCSGPKKKGRAMSAAPSNERRVF
jgi:hypothetical protein